MNSRCPVCWSPVLDDILDCSGCGTRQHARCAASSGGCVVAGCASPPTPAGDPSEAHAARLARPAEAARPASPVRVSRPPATHLAGVLAVPPLPASAHADPARGFFGRLRDSAWETLAILPRVVPLMLLALVLPSLPFRLGLVHFPFWLIWLYSMAASLAAPLVIYPAATLLFLEPELRSGPWSTLLRRTVATWRRYIPTMLAVMIALALPVAAMMPFVFFGGAIPAVLAFAFFFCALQLAPIAACTAGDAPFWRAWDLARANKLAMVGAAIATVALPSAVSLLLQLTVFRHALYGLRYLLAISLLIQLVTRIYPLAYLSLLYRDLTSR